MQKKYQFSPIKNDLEVKSKIGKMALFRFRLLFTPKETGAQSVQWFKGYKPGEQQEQHRHQGERQFCKIRFSLLTISNRSGDFAETWGWKGLA